MKRSKILVLILSAILTVSLIAATALTASALFIQGGTASESDWIAAPKNTLEKCKGSECTHESCDYVYSFAVVGDTQNINVMDVKGSSYMEILYSWIAENKDLYNIQYVLGVGDITQTYHTETTSAKNTVEAEWINAKDAIYLLEPNEQTGFKGIPYSLVRGNHDLASYFNSTFGGEGNAYYDTLKALADKGEAGFRNPNKLEDTYRKIEIDGRKYIIFTLDWHPSKAGDACLEDGEIDCLTWLDETLAANSDYQAIITLHSFIWYDGSITHDANDVFPKDNTLEAERPNWTEVSKTGGNSTPDEVWQVLKKHANVEMILCGHVDNDDLVTTQLRGDNGNTVTAMLVDGQTIDKTTEPVGLVAMLYVARDGKIMHVEYISPIRDKADKNAYFRDVNQFTVDLDLASGEYNADIYKKYNAVITTKDYNAHTFHFFIDSDSDMATPNTYYGSFDTWEDTLEAIDGINSSWKTAARKIRSFYIVMSKDYTDTQTGVHNDDAKHTHGPVIIDLNGNKLTLAANSSGEDIFLPLKHSASGIEPKYTIKNGNIDITGDAALALIQGSKNTPGEVNTLNLIDLTITYSAGATGSIVYAKPGDGTTCIDNINVTNCTIDASQAAGKVTLFAVADSNGNSANIKITGGSIKGNQTASTTLFATTDYKDSVTFAKDANGNYTTVTFKNNGTISTAGTPAGTYYSSESRNNFLTFGTPTENSGVYTYPLVAATYEVTPYGMINCTDYPLSKYPFVLFKSGAVVYGFSDWLTFIGTDLKNNKSLATGCTLYVRKDATIGGNTAWANRIRDLTIDLNGFILTHNTSHLFQCAGTNDGENTSTKITVKNGTLVTSSSQPPIAFNNWATSNCSKTYEFIFDGITIDASAKSNLIGSYGDGTPVGQQATVTFNDCDIKIGTNAPSNGAIFDLDDETSTSAGSNKNDITVIINGGTLSMANASKLSFATYDDPKDFSTNSPDSVVLGTGKNGKMLTVLMPSGANAPTATYKLTAGNFYLVKTADDGIAATYEFANLTNSYGADIPTNRASFVDYPFVIYYGGTFKGGYTTWTNVLEAAVGFVDTVSEAEACDTVYILLRRDFEHRTVQGNIANAKGKIVLDLQGYVLSTPTTYVPRTPTATNPATSTRVSNALFNSYIKYSDLNSDNAANTLAYASEFMVKNGTLKNDRSSAGMFVFDTAGTLNVSGYAQKQFIFNFENVEFLSVSQPIMHGWNDKSGTGLGITVNLSDCTFNFANSGSNKVSMLSFADSGNVFNAKINMNGCFAVSQNTANHSVYTIGTDDSISGSTIPSAYADVETYPVHLFTEDGEFIKGYSDISGAYTDIIAKKTGSYLIKVRRDMTKSVKKTIGVGFEGKITIDLGGHTVTVPSAGNYFLDLSATGNLSDTYKCTLIVKNGTLVKHDGRGLVCINYSIDLTNSSTADDTFENNAAYDFTFENVTFKATSATNAKNVIFNTWEDGFGKDGVTAQINVASVFNGCTFDLAGSVDGMTMLHLGHNAGIKDRVVHSATLNNCTVLADSAAQFNEYFAKLDANTLGRYDTVTYAKGFKITLPLDSEAPAGEYNGLVFTLDSKTDSSVTYTLAPEEYILKSSVTLYTDFIYNVYLPKKHLVSLVLNGNAVDLGYAEQITFEDGSVYYRVRVDLTSYEALADIAVTVTVNDGYSTYTSSFTFDICSYAASIIDGEYTEAEKTLAKDMLSYIRAAYGYFGKSSDKLASIDTVLGADYDTTSAPDMNKKAEAPSDSVFDGVSLNLGTTPSYRLYYSRKTAPSYTYTVGGREVEGTLGSDELGTYVEVKIYAYEMLSDLVFTDGSYSHTYNVYSYYEWASENAAEAAALVERLVKYCESAAAYKASIEPAE